MAAAGDHAAERLGEAGDHAAGHAACGRADGFRDRQHPVVLPSGANGRHARRRDRRACRTRGRRSRAPGEADSERRDYGADGSHRADQVRHHRRAGFLLHGEDDGYVRQCHRRARQGHRCQSCLQCGHFRPRRHHRQPAAGNAVVHRLGNQLRADGGALDAEDLQPRRQCRRYRGG